MRISMFIVGLVLLGLLVFARFLFLARWPIGWLMYLSNVMWEFLAKRVHVSRFFLELFSSLISFGLILASGVSWSIVVPIFALLFLVELAVRFWERNILTSAYTRLGGVGPSPSAHPELIFTLEAPFTERMPNYRLGVLLVGVPFEFELVVGNHSLIPTQTPVKVYLVCPSSWILGQSPQLSLGLISAGTVARASWIVRPDIISKGGILKINIESAGYTQCIDIAYDSCRYTSAVKIERIVIRRYPGARRSAFAWRGDMDLYDTITLQSIEGLEKCFGLAARYSFPQTMFISTRLSFDEKASRDWASHYGVVRGSSQIPSFVQWLRDNVDLRLSSSYPALSSRPFVIELGNHGHLHYSTSCSAAEENGWMSNARMGAGVYSWIGSDHSSFAEQRDNVIEAKQWCDRLFGFTTRSWSMPGRCNDEYTSQAIAAAGCEILSGSNVRAIDNVFFQPPPHHPSGTDSVELTARYPGDPEHIFHMGMLLFWLYRSLRSRLPMIFMCHQHMRQFEGLACTRFTEYIIRKVLRDFNGDFYVDTVFGIGKYWREVLSPKMRRVNVLLDDACIVIENQSDMDFERIPIDLELSDGGRSTLLVSVKSCSRVSIDLESMK